MKWIGALLLLSVTTWIGFDWSNKLNKRPIQIRQLKNALQILEAEMLYSQAPLQDAFIVISKQIPEPIKSFFQNISEKMNTNQIDLLQIWDEEENELIIISTICIYELVKLMHY